MGYWPATLIVLLLSLALPYAISKHRKRRGKSARAGSPASNGTTSTDDAYSNAPKGGVRLVQIHAPAEGDESDVDIIAIHGLDTKSPDTWIWKPQKGGSTKVNWLADPDMLPAQVGRARVFTCDWPADLFRQADSRPLVLEEFARLLLVGIKARPRPKKGNTTRKDPPILFIASCLGGVLLMKALVMADGEYLSLREATQGIVFLATPFQGTSFLDVADWAEPSLRAMAALRHQHVATLLDSLKGSTFDLSDLVRSFTISFLNRPQRPQVHTFYETGTTSLYRKMPLIGLMPPRLLDLLWPPKPLVDMPSATLANVAHPLPLERTHVMMNKFSGPGDPEYNKVIGKIAETLEVIRAGSPLEQADAWILNNHYNSDRLNIERLSGDPLPMERCYINLSIVELLGGKEGRIEEGYVRLRPYQTSLFARLKIEAPESTNRVELSAIFNARKDIDGNMTRPRRILIRGRAGVGKTTLCKRIVYDFVHHKRWTQSFDRLLWVPLRRLKGQQTMIYNFEDLFHYEYFSEKGQEDGRRLAKHLWQEVSDTGGSKTLFVLDGLDEISQDLNRNSHMVGFLRTLLDQPNVIITSRPHAKIPVGLRPLDLELETVGFQPHQVKSYLDNTFTDTTGADEIQSFLHKHWLIQGLVRIPIQLDALCFTWDVGSQTVPETMTAVYQAIELRLWKKDILRLEKRHEGDLVTDDHIQGSPASVIQALLKAEIHYVESLAFTGLQNDVIDYDAKQWGRVYEHFGLPDKPLLPDKTLPRLSFLRTSDTSPGQSQRSYHFLHLTFQEYFAARYFVRRWRATEPIRCLQFSNGRIETTSVTTFLQRHKYDGRYDVFWRFVAGLLNSEDDSEVSGFLQAIEDEPLDLIGPAHQRLVMHCLSELDSTEMPVRVGLENQLLQWAFLECDKCQRSYLASEMEFPERVMETALREGSAERRRALLESLERKPIVPPSTIELVTSWLGDDSLSIGVRTHAAAALASQPALPEASLEALVAQLDNKTYGIRSGAETALTRQSNLPQTIRAALPARLQNPGAERNAMAAFGGKLDMQKALLGDLNKRLEKPQLKDAKAAAKWDAVNAVGGQSDLSQQAREAVAEQLEDILSGIKWAAENFSDGQSSLPKTILEAVVTRLEDPKSLIRQTAVQALGREEDVPQAVLGSLAGHLRNSASESEFRASNSFNQQGLSRPLFEAATARLEHANLDVRNMATNVLRNQTDLPCAVWEAVAAKLQLNPDIMQDAMVALKGKLSLPQAILEAAAARLERPEDTRGRLLEPLYEFMLQRGFDEQVSWYVEDGISCVSMPEGSTTASVPDYQQYLAMINAARPHNFPSIVRQG